jgi:hypothetical protein
MSEALRPLGAALSVGLTVVWTAVVIVGFGYLGSHARPTRRSAFLSSGLSPRRGLTSRPG